MTQLESQLQSSIIYRRLVNTIEDMANVHARMSNFTAEVKFSPEAKAEMTLLINDAVGEIVRHAMADFVYKCPRCDSDRVYLQCVACRETTKVGQ